MQLHKDPARTLEAIELFNSQVQQADRQSKEMASYLHLQACIALNRYHCAALAVDKIIALVSDLNKKPELLKLSTQLHYQNENYALTIERAKQWVKATSSVTPLPSTKDSAEIYSLEGYAHYHLKSFNNAISSMGRAIEIEKTEPRQLFILSLYQKKSDWENVNRVLRSLVEEYSSNPNYWERYAYSFLKLGDANLALGTLGSAYKSRRLPKKAILIYAQLLVTFQAPQKAISVLEQNPELINNPLYARILRQSSLLARDHQKAEYWLKQSESKGAQFTRGMVAYQQGKWQQVINIFKDLDPSQKSNHYYLLLSAISQFELREWQQARIAFSRLSGTKYDLLSAQWISQIDYLNTP
ncbi:hypothetical protein PD716_24625 [Vibrio gigantis]|uniref:tetratricopeptide repeat protein n=1 Tax=Vibrio gigantis TaxID=296199 RepID=UPI002FCCB1B4